MAKKTTQPQKQTPRIKGQFTARTWIREARAKSSEPLSEAEALHQLEGMVRAGKVKRGPLVGLYPGLQSYHFAE